MLRTELSGDDKVNISSYCGVETDDLLHLTHIFSHHMDDFGFDFIVAPLIDPNYRPSLKESSDGSPSVLPFSGSELLLSHFQWSKQVVGKLSSWIDLDSIDDKLRIDSEIALKQEIAWAAQLSLQVCILPTPKGVSCANYARCVKEILHNLKAMQLWLRIPLLKFDDDARDADSKQTAEGLVDPWEIWNSFRLLCDHHDQLLVVLDVSSVLPSINSIERWVGEPVYAAFIHTDSFTTNDKGPFLSKQLQMLVTDFFHHSIRLIISGPNDPKTDPLTANQANNFDNDPLRHPFRSYLDYFAYMYRRMVPLSGSELSKISFRDVLHRPLQLLLNSVSADNFKTSETDTIKYNQYQRAISKALTDRVTKENALTVTMVLIILEPASGLLISASLSAAALSDRKVKIYALESNQNVYTSLHNWIQSEALEDRVTVVYSAIQPWDLPEKADILISDFLGPFADDQLSPELLDASQWLLKDDGISIPASYTSFLEPVTSSKLYTNARSQMNLANMETRYSAKLHRVASLAPSEPLFGFYHPNNSTTKSNKRHRKIQFKIPYENGSVLVHGLVGYFHAILYQDIYLSTEPSNATTDLVNCSPPAFFPLRKPVYVALGSPFEVHFWRCCKPSKVWYEWCVSLPSLSPMHNSCGRSFVLHSFF